MPPQNGKLKLRDIARLTGHTVGTVSKALHDKPGLAPKTREYILKVARENGYIGNALAGSLRSGTTKTAAIILGDIANPLFSIMAKGLIAALARVGYSAILLNSEEDSEEEVRAITTALSRNVDGVFLCPTQRSTEGVELLRRNGAPCVLVARYFQDSGLDSVVFDDLNGGHLAARHLLALGHRDILFLGGPECVSSARERREGFMAEIEAAGASARVCEVPIIADASQSIEQAISQAQGVTAVCAFSDYIAWQVLFAFSERGVRVPEDVAVIGFDDIQSEIHVPVPLTTIGCDKRAVGDHAVELLMRRIAEPDAPVRQVHIQTHLVQRGTTCPRD